MAAARSRHLLLGALSAVLLCVVVATTSGCGGASTSGEGGTPGNPPAPPAGGSATEARPGSPPATATGSELFAQRCSGCHGPTGQGATATALTGAAREEESELRAIITNGKGKMPAFGTQLSAEQIDLLVQHVKTLGG
jgi:mono/diheme cytochrome c family protein